MDAHVPQRVSDTDRQTVVDRLVDGVGAGRLTAQEYDERLVSALTARTAEDLAPLVADLPVGQLQERADVAARRRDDLQEWLREWQYWSGGAVLLVGVWGVHSAAEGAPQRFWPVVPLGIWAVVLLAAALWPTDD